MSDLSNFRLVTPTDAAAIFGVCVRTINNYIRDGLLPKPVHFGSRDYWHPADFEAFLSRTFRPESTAPPGRCPMPEASFTADAVPDAAQPASSKSRAPAASHRDSSAVVRQQARQREKLRALNRDT